jgi:L-lysine epsilon oxidase C-terminal domain
LAANVRHDSRVHLIAAFEASWLFAKKEVWDKPFRLALNRTVGTIPVPGENRRDVVIAAGAFSQQMALPWQADFLACAADYLGNRRRRFNDGAYALARFCSGNAGENPARSRGLSLRTLARLFERAAI